MKYLNSNELYTETAGARRDSKTSNSSSTKNDYYYDKENELYSQRRVSAKPKLAPPREERELINNTTTTSSSNSSTYQQRHQQQQQLTSSLSPIPSPTLNVTKFFCCCLVYLSNCIRQIFVLCSNPKYYFDDLLILFISFCSLPPAPPATSRRALASCTRTVH